MAFNGYRNFATWLFMVHFEEFLYETLKEQQQQEKDLKYHDVYEFVKYIINEMYDSTNKNNIGSAFLNDVINSFLNEVDIREVTEHLEHNLKE